MSIRYSLAPTSISQQQEPKTTIAAMLKDRMIRMICIPLLGFIIPWVSGVIRYEFYSGIELIIIHAYFVSTSLCIWVGCSRSHQLVRPLTLRFGNPLQRIGLVLAASIVSGTCISLLLLFAWSLVSGQNLSTTQVSLFTGCSLLAVIIFAMMYEIIFMGIEQKNSSSQVQQMHRELTQAELATLAQESDYHFLFNSLNAMQGLIAEDPAQARIFNEHLSQVYKYFLLNKKRDLVSLEEELQFTQSYFRLLQIRFADSIRMCLHIPSHLATQLVPPCSLQLLVENAIKHNEFSSNHPLQIIIEKTGDHIKVSNNVHPKSFPHESTRIGLKNLNMRFMLTSQQQIEIDQSPDIYSVKLPLIHQTQSYSHD